MRSVTYLLLAQPFLAWLPSAGVSLSRGAFYFQPGQWHNIALTVRMNDVGQANGFVEVRVNGERKIYYDQVAYRTKPGTCNPVQCRI